MPTLPCRGGESLLRELFEPLGYTVEATEIPLDEQFPEWGASRLYRVRLRHTIRLYELLRHLYILIPVLDGAKHYYISEAEVDKLIRQGQEWLPDHPARERIILRYLNYRPTLVEQAIASILRDEATPEEPPADDELPFEARLERPLSLQEQRIGAITATLKSLGARRVMDLRLRRGRTVDRACTRAGIRATHGAGCVADGTADCRATTQGGTRERARAPAARVAAVP
jgi:3' terminal RNA ribose 2'-O-methyltransferase Hen1